MSDKKDSGGFDKFIADICKREELAREKAKSNQQNTSNLPQRKYNQLYREKWQNRVTWRPKK